MNRFSAFDLVDPDGIQRRRLLTLLFSAGNPFPESWLVSGIGRQGAKRAGSEAKPDR